MKTTAKAAIYFSAYPLKAVEQAAGSAIETNQSPYLKALLSGQRKTVSNLRVSPMVNPYKDTVKVTPLRPSPTKQVDPQGGEWFNHYE